MLVYRNSEKPKQFESIVNRNQKVVSLNWRLGQRQKLLTETLLKKRQKMAPPPELVHPKAKRNNRALNLLYSSQTLRP